MKNLHEDPRHSVKNMGKDLRAIGNALSKVALATYDFTPLAKCVDITLDSYEADDNTTYTDQRTAKKLQTVEHIVNTCNAFIKYIATSSVRKVAADGTVLSDTMITDVWLTEKVIVGAGGLAGQVGKNISLAGEGMYDLLPIELMDEIVTYAKTPTGDIVAISEKTGINLGQVIKLKAISLEHNSMCEAARNSQDPMVREILSQKVAAGINPTSQAILKDGYYEVNGMKFTEYYYNRLWNNGRKAPSLTAQKILETADTVVLDIEKPGFLKYETTNQQLFYNPSTKKYEKYNWELVYNPVTKEVWHMEPL